jgi:2-haloacid dehalogenase
LSQPDGRDPGTHERERRSIDAVFFDLFGTLLDLSALVDACETAAPDRGRELATRWRERQLEFSWLRTTMGTFVDFDRVTADALEAAIAELSLAPTPAAFSTLKPAFERLPVHAAAPGVLGRIRSSGLWTGVLTNGSRRTVALVLARTGLDRTLDYALSVDAVGRFKPDPAVYRLACEATGLEAARIGFVTANGWDAAGAAGFGFRVAWLRHGPSAPFPRVGARLPMIATWESLHETLLGVSDGSTPATPSSSQTPAERPRV